MKFFLGVLGVIIYNIMNAYNVIRLPQYITDKDPNEEVFLSTGVAFATLVVGFFGLKSFNKNIFGSLNHYNMLKMIGVFIVTCYIGMSLTYAADNHLDPTLFSALQYSQLFLAFVIGYFFEGEKFILKANEFKEMTGLNEGLTIKSTQVITLFVTIIVVSIL